MTAENTYIGPFGERRCRICLRAKDARRAPRRRTYASQYARQYYRDNAEQIRLRARESRLNRTPDEIAYDAERASAEAEKLRKLFPADPAAAGARWTPQEDAIILRDDILIGEMWALLKQHGTQRSYRAIEGRRRKLRNGLIAGAPACRQGERNTQAKLTETEVLEIRATDHLTQSELAEIYGVSQTLISGIKRRKFWSHI